ncbi:MAG: signal peptidase II [Coriobacteriia bacterium]|nr:signal peptidase II [Coriobacteriia bacterium]
MQVGRRIAVEARRPLATFWIAGVVVLLVDQLTKALIRAWLDPAVSFPLIDGVFHITHVRNTGAAFGLMPGARPLFLATSALVLLGITAYWFVMRPRARWLVISLALVGSGATGNLIDRMSAGRVTDFLDFILIGFPVFNVADIGIVVGVGMLVVWILFGPEHPTEAPQTHE